MTRLGDTLRPMVAGLIERAGAPMTLRRAGVPSYDPTAGAVTESTVDVALSGVLEEVETGHADGVVRRGDRLVTVAAESLRTNGLQIDPAPGDDLVIGGDLHRVVSVTATYAGAKPAVFRLHVRR
ncbi:hypothetical protein [Thalassobaculum salexigens]|uniref:hypothetical protein n=1 Tax=Thalassobaculum salexigens TaxID=455360 RepID=UPI0004269DAC|nr:hypothetical protein [Thalassobaculum salexigens]